MYIMYACVCACVSIMRVYDSRMIASWAIYAKNCLSAAVCFGLLLRATFAHFPASPVLKSAMMSFLCGSFILAAPVYSLDYCI